MTPPYLILACFAQIYNDTYITNFFLQIKDKKAIITEENIFELSIMWQYVKQAQLEVQRSEKQVDLDWYFNWGQVSVWIGKGTELHWGGGTPHRKYL